MASARLLLQDGDSEGACNRADYAMFDAAHAILLRHGAEWGRSLNQVERPRLIADYTGEPIDPDEARWVVEQATEFVEALQAVRAPAGLGGT